MNEAAPLVVVTLAFTLTVPLPALPMSSVGALIHFPPAPTLTILRALLAVPTETVLATSATEFAPMATASAAVTALR